MSESDIQQLVNAITTPNLVEKLMFAVTTLYLFATILVFLENRRMVKAAITSSNISLFDKRLEIIQEIRELTHEHASMYSKNNSYRIRILFPKQLYHSFDSYILRLAAFYTQQQDYYDQVNDLNNLIFHMITHLPYSSLDDAIQEFTDKELFMHSKELCEIISEAKRLTLEQNKKWEDPMKLYSELRDSEYKNKLAKAGLLSAIEQYISSTIN